MSDPLREQLPKRLRAIAEHLDAMGGSGYVAPEERELLRRAADELAEARSRPSLDVDDDIGEIRAFMAKLDAAEAAFDALCRPWAAKSYEGTMPDGYREALKNSEEANEELEAGAERWIRTLLAALQRAEADNKALRDLLVRISKWDLMDTTCDGPYWRREIDKVLNNVQKDRSD